MYAAYFGLKENPFAITPDPRYLYLSERHREALAHLLFGVGEGGGGFVQLTGEVGTGKTTVCRAFLEQLPPHVDVAMVLNPRVTAGDLLRTLCHELRVPLPPDPDSVNAMIDRLNVHLLEAHAEGRRTVVLIDEAQNLSAEVLEQIRLLTNLETDTHKLLQIFLVGQPELRQLLAQPALRQVAQRITARYHLAPLNRREAEDYIRHRLAVAGCQRPLFTPGALGLVHRYSGGVPRLINILCDRALLGAYATDRQRVEAGVVRRAAAELQGEGRQGIPRRAPVWLKAAAALVLVSVAGLWGVSWLGGNGQMVTDVPAGGPVTAAVATVRLDELPLVTDLAVAQQRLSAQWGLDSAVPEAEGFCGQVNASGLQCRQERGTWQTLRQLDRPALLTLEDDVGPPRYAVVVGLDGGSVYVADAGGRRTVPIETLSRYWYGDFLLLWRPAPGGALVVRPGDRGEAVFWLSQALTHVLGGDDEGSPSDVFDAALEQQVREFQDREGLSVDGIAGPRTLMHLNAALQNPATPVLHPGTED